MFRKELRITRRRGRCCSLESFKQRVEPRTKKLMMEINGIRALARLLDSLQLHALPVHIIRCDPQNGSRQNGALGRRSCRRRVRQPELSKHFVNSSTKREKRERNNETLSCNCAFSLRLVLRRSGFYAVMDGKRRGRN